MEEDEENKYDYGIYSHSNRVGLTVKKISKGTKGKGVQKALADK
jgi:hypothetical protein